VPKEDPAKAELTRLNGTWKVVSFQRAGVEQIENDTEKTITFKNGEFTWGGSDEPFGKIVSIDPTKTPKEVDYTYTRGPLKDKRQKGIYTLDGDTFVDCFPEGAADSERPTEFKSTKENGLTLVTYKRIKKKD
jgi:uncharacterized protein (TIGR03067 family)